MKIGDYRISFNLPPLIIAEMSGNHNQSLGEVVYGASADEKKISFIKAVFVHFKGFERGALLTLVNLRCVRPRLGLAPKYYEMLLGKLVNQDVKKGMPMVWEMVIGSGIE